jgi:hypothetical protein
LKVALSVPDRPAVVSTIGTDKKEAYRRTSLTAASLFPISTFLAIWLSCRGPTGLLSFQSAATVLYSPTPTPKTAKSEIVFAFSSPNVECREPVLFGKARISFAAAASILKC